MRFRCISNWVAVRWCCGLLAVALQTFRIMAGGGRNLPGDNGPATAASLSDLRGLAIDRQGNLYIVDTSNNRIRAVRGPIP